MDAKRFHAVLLLVLATTFTLSPAFSQLISMIVLTNTGEILPYIVAKTGSAKDIQAAVDVAAASADGIGTVHVPAGTYNFVNVGEAWRTIEVPAGVSIVGAPTQKYPNGSVVSWNTVLVMPWDVPGDWNSAPYWFSITGSSDPNKPSRLSDIKIIGYRSIDPRSTTLQCGIYIQDVMNFRIDHDCLEHTCGGGIVTMGLTTNGVIDHCRIYNIYGFDDLSIYTNGNIGYGIEIHRGFFSTGYEPLVDVLGKYTDHSIYIENCYFSRWRHCVSSGHGAHYVFRYNTIDSDFGHFSLDCHGLRDSGTDRWGTRAAEFYENVFTNAVPTDLRLIFQDGGGSGVWFNNYIDASYRSDGIALYAEDYVPDETWHLKDFYLWGKLGPWSPSWDGIPSGFTADRNVKADWSRSAGTEGSTGYPNVDPSWSIAGYVPYTYPHPLTIG